MKHPILSFLLALTIASVSTACAVEVEAKTEAEESVVVVPLAVSEPNKTAPKDRKSSVRIVTGSGICSATKIAPKVLLSASHCFHTETKILIVGDKPAIVVHIVADDNDHALVLLDEIVLEDLAALGPAPKEGDSIHYWGNPYVFTMLLRRGYVSGFDNVNTIYDINGYHGDSGAGVFNDKKQLVGVISYIHGKNSFSMMGSYPFNFTAAQLKEVGLKPMPLLMTGTSAGVKLNYQQ